MATINIDNTLNTESKYDFFRRYNQYQQMVNSQREHIDINDQQKMISYINKQIRDYGRCTITINSTAELTSNTLSQVSDLSKLTVKIQTSFVDLKGNYKPQYKEKKYYDRMNYTGYEAFNIIKKIEKLETHIDMSLPTRERAKQIYDLIASEYSYMYDHENYPNGHKIAASLRGITNYNETGKKGLVCAGYSSLYKELCLRCGIACEYITGYAGERHAWNVVIDGDEIIPVDVTWKVGTGKDWFGVSHEFQKEHEALEEEVFKNYTDKYHYRDYIKGLNLKYQKKSPTPQPVKEHNSYDDIINEVLQILDTKYGYGEGVIILRNYIITNDPSYVTRTNDARNKISKVPRDYIANYIYRTPKQTSLSSIITRMSKKYTPDDIIYILANYANNKDVSEFGEELKNIPREQIIRFVDSKKSLDYILRIMKAKYGSRGKNAFLAFLHDKNTQRITRDYNARSIASTINKDDLESYIALNKLDEEKSLNSPSTSKSIEKIRDTLITNGTISSKDLDTLAKTLGISNEQKNSIINNFAMNGQLDDYQSSNTRKH